MRSARPVPLSPSEIRMDFGAWVADEIPVIERHNAQEWTCACPRCGAEKLAVNVAVKAWQCWRCHFGGWSPVRLVAAVLDCTLAQAEAIVASHAVGVRLGRIRGLEDAVGSTSRDLPVAPAPPGTLWRLDDATSWYASRRGIPYEHALSFGLSAVAGDGSRSKADSLVAGRLLIPVWVRGRFVFWVARELAGDGKIKTVNLPTSCENPLEHPPECACKHEKWGLSPVPSVAGSGEVLVGAHLVQRGAPLVVVEGPIDAAVCGPGFVATLGAKLSFSQAALIAELGPSEIVIMFDPDEAGEEGTAKALPLLSAIAPTRVAVCPAGADPAELGRSRALDLARQASSSPGVRHLGRPRPGLSPRTAALKPIIGKLGPA